MDEDNPRKVEQFKFLTQTARDTPMGRLLRKFWHPIALVEEVPKGKAKAVRILSEDLTLYRAESGRSFIPYKSVWDCNWFQQVENSLDAVHVSFAHLWGSVGQFGASVTAAIPELSYIETSAGIRQVAARPNNNVRVSDWTFPNN